MHELNCRIAFAEADKDYDPVNDQVTLTRDREILSFSITIKDNLYHDGNRKFLFRVHGFLMDEWVEICILDDEWGMLSSCLLMHI